MDYYYGVSAKEIRKENTLPANRFIKTIKEILESSRGKGLTTERRDLLRKWERNSKSVTVNRIKKLESMLQRRIQLLEADDTIIYPGVNKYFTHGTIMKVYRISNEG